MQELIAFSSCFLFLALGVDFILGDPRSVWHPVCLMGRWAHAVENVMRLDKNGYGMFLRGVVAYVFVVLPWVLAVYFLVIASEYVFGVAGAMAMSVACVYICLAPRSLAEHACKVYVPLQQGDAHEAQTALSMIVGREVHNLDNYGIARACVESVAENFVDGVFATLFWASVGFVYGGFAGCGVCVMWHRVSNVLDAEWGKKNEKYKRFGTCAARCDDALNFLPARLALPVIALAAVFVPKCRGLDALQVGYAFRHAHASPNSAWSEAAFAGALGVKLGGSAVYGGRVVEHPVLGVGTDKVEVEHILRAVRLMWMSTLLGTVGWSVLLYVVCYV